MESCAKQAASAMKALEEAEKEIRKNEAEAWEMARTRILP